MFLLLLVLEPKNKLTSLNYNIAKTERYNTRVAEHGLLNEKFYPSYHLNFQRYLLVQADGVVHGFQRLSLQIFSFIKLQKMSQLIKNSIVYSKNIDKF